MHEWGGLTRFASSSIHQSTHREDTGIRVRVVSDGRIGVAGTNDFSPEGARRAAESALEMAEVAAPDPLFPGLAPPAPVAEHDRFDEATATTSPERGRRASPSSSGSARRGSRPPGAFETLASEVAVANTNGQFCWAPTTQASVTTVVSGDDGGNGFAEVFAGRRRRGRPRGDRPAGRGQGGRLARARRPRARPVPGRARARGRLDARRVPRLDRVRRPGAARGTLVLLGQAGPAGRGAGRLDLRRRRGGGHARPPVRLRGRAEIAGRPDHATASSSAACTTCGPPSRPARRRPATPSRRRTRRGRSRSTCSWSRADRAWTR